MADFPALPLWTDALAADTDHLTNEEYGLYQRMLNTAWRASGCDLPNDPQWLIRRFRLSQEEYDKICRPLIEEFWSVDGKNRLVQKRLKKERAFVEERSKKQSLRSKARWNKEKGVSRGNAAPHITGNAPTPTPTPTPKSIERAARLPADWTLPEEYRSWAIGEGWNAESVSLEADKFRDYWISVSGQRACKRDWLATWRNWMRNVKKDSVNGITGEMVTDRHKLVAFIAKQTWRDGWGEKPTLEEAKERLERLGQFNYERH